MSLDEELKDLMLYLIGYSTEYIAGIYQEGVEMGIDGEPRWSAYTVNKLIEMCNKQWDMSLKEVIE
jgi:hypothetical protein